MSYFSRNRRSVHMYIVLYICTSFCTYVHRSVHMYIVLYICTSFCTYVHRSVHMYIALYICMRPFNTKTFRRSYFTITLIFSLTNMYHFEFVFLQRYAVCKCTHPLRYGFLFVVLSTACITINYDCHATCIKLVMCHFQCV